MLVLVGGIGTAARSRRTPARARPSCWSPPGQQALDEANAQPRRATPEPTDDPGDGARADDDAPPQPVGGDQITAIGDSVMLAAAPTLYEKFPGIYVDAAGVAVDLCRARRSSRR